MSNTDQPDHRKLIIFHIHCLHAAFASVMPEAERGKSDPPKKKKGKSADKRENVWNTFSESVL